MKSIWCCSLCLCLAATSLKAQQVASQLRVQRLGSLYYNQVADAGWNGWGLQVERSRMGTGRIGWLVGAELGYTGWGNQLLAKGGGQFRLMSSPRWMSSVRLYAMPGVALFRPRLLFTYRVGTEAVVVYKFSARFGLMASAGLAYSACPTYKDYGRINRYIDVPLSIGVQWQRTWQRR
jgi:hypothetical protein